MPAIDWLLAGLLLASVVLGLWRGLVYEVLSVLSWVAAFVLAQWLGPEVGRQLPMTGATEIVRYAAGFVLVFIAAAFVGGLLAWLFQKMAASVGLRPIDRVLGGVFGLVRGMVLVLAATVVMGMTPLKSSAWWQESTGAAAAEVTLRELKPMLPKEFGKYLP